MILFNVPMAILHPLAPVAQLIEDVRRDDDDDDSASTIPTIFRARVRRRRFFENCADVFCICARRFFGRRRFWKRDSDDDDFPHAEPGRIPENSA